jgi:hypothetical protein
MTAAFLPWESEPKCLQSSLYYSCRAGGLHALVQRSRLNKVFTLPYLCRISVMQKTAAKSVFAKNFSHQQYLAKEEYRGK